MKLLIISHKLVWEDTVKNKFYTNGGFSLQVSAISELFQKTRILCPVSDEERPSGLTEFSTKNISFTNLLNKIKKTGLSRKIYVLFWCFKNITFIKKEINNADAVHIPLMGDIGIIGFILCLIMKKKLFVRHCGNWYKNENLIEFMIKLLMTLTAGKNNVMFATGGGFSNPSKYNKNIKWIFSTSLNSYQINKYNTARSLLKNAPLKIFVAGRQTKSKGTHHVIKAVSILKRKYDIKLIIAGEGPDLKFFKTYSSQLNLGVKHVSFLGQIDHNQLHEVFKNSDIFCFPSVSSEGFPKVVVEAITHGLPSLVSPVSVLPYLFRNGGGVILDFPFAESIVSNLEKLILDNQRYKKISKEAVALSKQYSIESWQNEISENLKENWI
jgi:glycosyltransferase involved in cell wall biosynthesis